MSGHTPGPWKLIAHGNEQYPFPLSVHTADGEYWIARDGEVSSEANARLIAAAPETAAERDRLKEINADLLSICRRIESIGRSPWGTVYELQRLVPDARAAIARAEPSTGEGDPGRLLPNHGSGP